MTGSLPFGPDYGFGLYIHWPYCSKICPYCDFNVYTAKVRDSSPLVHAISTDLARHAGILTGHPQLGSIYFGGGTPSLMSPSDIARLVDQTVNAFGLTPNAEITLEANPNDILSADLQDWKEAGINRLSIGVQSLNDDALHFLGRDHDTASARGAVDLATQHFENISIDLIYARPGQTAAAWETELTSALRLGAPHLSLYELTIEERTAFGKRAARGDLTPMPDDDQADLYELTQTITEAHDLPAYEVSNHARSPEYQSRHNLTYWRGGDWIGLGPGAHGRLTVSGQRVATLGGLRPDNYIASVETSLAPQTLTKLDTARELFALGLRPAEGFDVTRAETLAGAKFDRSTLDNFISNSLISEAGQRIALTREGRLLADRIAAELSP